MNKKYTQLIKMLSIRAGLIHDIIKCNLSQDSLKEIINFSGLKELIDDFNLMKKIIPILKEDSLMLNQYNSSTDYFSDPSGFIEKYLIDNIVKSDNEAVSIKTINNINPLFNLSESNIYNSIEMDYEYDITNNENKYLLLDIANTNIMDFVKYITDKIIKTNKIKNAITLVNTGIHITPKEEYIDTVMTPYNRNTYGIRNEKKVIDKLIELGHAVEPCKGQYTHLDCIKIGGRPDGYITGGPYKGYYLEIKSKPFNKLTDSDLYQIYTYYGITGKPILLVTSNKGELGFEPFEIEKLERCWKILKKRLAKSCKKLLYLLSINNLDKYEELRINTKKKRFIFK